MSSGSLLQSISTNEREGKIFNKNKKSYAISYESIKFDNNKLIIPKHLDSFIPLYIKSDKKIEYMILSVGTSIINQIPLDFCNKIYGNISKISNDNFLYKIPWHILCEEGILVLKLFTNVNIKLVSKNICNAQLIVKYYYLSNEARVHLHSNLVSCFIKTFQWITFNIVKGINKKRINLDGISKGLFIENIEIDKINNIKLIFNSHERLNYNKNMIDLLVKKIGKDIIYISLEDDINNFDDFVFNSSPNFSRIENVIIYIDSDIEQKIKIVSLPVNDLIYNQGFAGLRYLYDYKIDTIEELYINLKLDENTYCPIGLNKILENSYFMICKNCNKKFNKKYIMEWLENKRTCPCCRAIWTNNTIYVNSNKKHNCIKL